MTGANGKSQAFGFALFESPEVVMRCLRCLDGVELPDTSPEGRAAGKPPKALKVNVDAKTKAFLDEFEETVGRTEVCSCNNLTYWNSWLIVQDDEEADAAARRHISQIVGRIIEAHAPKPETSTRRGGGQSPITVIVPAHLQDLREGDLPENQRVAVLDQIAVFRENAARKERAKKALEEEQELAKFNSPVYKKPPNAADYGYESRPFAQTKPFQAPQQNSQQNQQQQQRGYNDRSSGANHQNSRGADPQGYSKPVDFVKAKTAEGKVDSGRTDQEEEELRRMKIARDKEQVLREVCLDMDCMLIL